MGARGQQILAETLADVPEDDDDLNAEEQESLEETLVDQATASQTIAELAAEIVSLQDLEQQAKASSPLEKTASGMSFPAFFRTNPRCMTQGDACGKLSSSASTATL